MRTTRGWGGYAMIPLLVLAMAVSGGVPVAAQGDPSPAGAPVDIHSGSCSDPINEPAYDAGQLERAEYDEEDSLLNAGLIDGEIDGVEVSGTDIDRDGTIEQDEIITAPGVQPIVYRAESNVDQNAGELEDYVVLIHQSPEEYGTYLACGSISDAEEIDDGLLVPLQPIDDGRLRGYAIFEDEDVTTYIFEASAFSAQASVAPAGPFPVGIHSGTCTNPVDEPAYDVALAELVPLRFTDEQAEEEETVLADDAVAENISDELQTLIEEAGDRFTSDDDVYGGVFEDGTLNDTDDGFLTDDVDGDGLMDIGSDLNGDGLLGREEILGSDRDGDSALSVAEVDRGSAFLPMLGTYKFDGEIDADGEELVLEGPYVIVVHEGADENYSNYLACGEIRPALEDDQILVLLSPVSGSSYSGVAIIPFDEGEAAGFLYRREGIASEDAAEPTPVPAAPTEAPAPTEPPAPTATATPAPTETPIPTAVITETEIVEEETVVSETMVVTEVVEVTEVVTETEVVLAPTATAAAEG